MTDTRDRNLKYGENRYGFLLSPSEQKAGVSPEFAHSKVSEPVKNLAIKTDKALSLRTEDQDYLLAVKLLQECSAIVQNSLDNNISQHADAENIESTNNSYNTHRF